jgi:hypothetical protein
MIGPSDLGPGSPVQSCGVEDVEPWLVERISEDPTIRAWAIWILNARHGAPAMSAFFWKIQQRWPCTS